MLPGALSAMVGLAGAPVPTAQSTGIEQAARQLEVTFLTQLLQAMRKTVTDSDLLPRSPERDVYDGAFDTAVAEALAARDPLGMVASVSGRGGRSSPEGKMPIAVVEDQMTGRSEHASRSTQ